MSLHAHSMFLIPLFRTSYASPVYHVNAGDFHCASGKFFRCGDNDTVLCSLLLALREKLYRVNSDQISISGTAP